MQHCTVQLHSDSEFVIVSSHSSQHIITSVHSLQTISSLIRSSDHTSPDMQFCIILPVTKTCIIWASAKFWGLLIYLYPHFQIFMHQIKEKVFSKCKYVEIMWDLVEIPKSFLNLLKIFREQYSHACSKTKCLLSI